MTPAERAREIAERAIGRCEQTTSSGRSVACADCIAEVVADVVAAQAAQTQQLERNVAAITEKAQRYDHEVGQLKAALEVQAAQTRHPVERLRPLGGWRVQACSATCSHDLRCSEVEAAQTRQLEQERDELRQLIATGSRGAEISPVIRRMFAVGSKAAAERDALTLRLESEAAQTRALREALEALWSAWGERSGNAKEESARLAWFVARNELRTALTGAPREPHA